MVPRKGVDDCIRGFAKAIRGGISGRLLIVGCDTPGCVSGSRELNRLRGIAESEGVLSAIHFAGQCSRDEIRKYYGACDVFVTAPWYEPFGITPLEAMACARPVIGSKVGGIQFTVRDGETGFHVPPRDPAAIAEKLQLLYRDPVLRRQLGASALQWVKRPVHLATDCRRTRRGLCRSHVLPPDGHAADLLTRCRTYADCRSIAEVHDRALARDLLCPFVHALCLVQRSCTVFMHLSQL